MGDDTRESQACFPIDHDGNLNESIYDSYF